jgi:hypothetical protein
VGLVLVVPSPASAATIVGSTGTPIDVNYPNTENRVWVQDVQAGEGGSEYTVTAPGVITSWSSMANDVPNRTQKLLITRNANADTTWDVVARDVLRTLVTPSVLNVFTGLHIPVAAGDQLALYSPAAQPGAGHATSAIYTNNPSTNVARSLTGAEPGASFTVSGTPEPNTLLNAAAAVEPDADGDAFGDETQDLCPTNAAVQVACPVLTANPVLTAKKCPKGKRLKKVKGKKKCVKKKRKKK